MAITLTKETRTRLLSSIKRYAEENLELEEEMGDLAAGLLLDFFVAELGPSIYNAAIADAQQRLHDHVTDLDGTCHEPELAYWPRP